MKITAIKQQLKREGRVSVFIDGAYAFSLSENALLASKLVRGQEISPAERERYERLANEDALYEQAARYAVLRLRTRWEMEEYLRRKDASPALAKEILNKLSNIELIDDGKFARAFAADRQRLRPTSRRKIIYELRAKHVPEDVIRAVTQEEDGTDRTALQDLIRRKRQQTRYQDDLKLMQYLSRQGFSYGDIKEALNRDAEQE